MGSRPNLGWGTVSPHEQKGRTYIRTNNERMNDYEPVEGDYDSQAVTLEDQHGEVTEQEAHELHAQLGCEVWGYHRHPCPMRTYEDDKAEFWNELAVGAANGK